MDIRLELGYDHRIRLMTPTKTHEWNIEFVEPNESLEYPYFRSEHFDTTESHYFTLKDDKKGIEDFKKMVENIWEMFPSSVYDMEIVDPSLIEWIISVQPTIRYVHIRDDVITSFETLDRLFKSLKVTQYFYLYSYDAYYATNCTITRPIPYRSVSIDNYWITLPAILNGTNSVILLSGSRLLPTDINTILKVWQTGTKLQNLEYLRIDTDLYLKPETCYNEMYMDLDLAVSDENDGRPRTINIRHDYDIRATTRRHRIQSYQKRWKSWIYLWNHHQGLNEDKDSFQFPSVE